MVGLRGLRGKSTLCIVASMQSPEHIKEDYRARGFEVIERCLEDAGTSLHNLRARHVPPEYLQSSTRLSGNVVVLERSLSGELKPTPLIVLKSGKKATPPQRDPTRPPAPPTPGLACTAGLAAAWMCVPSSGAIAAAAAGCAVYWLMHRAYQAAPQRRLASFLRSVTRWKMHPSRKCEHSGFEQPPVRAFAFAFSSKAHCDCGLARVEARSTLRQNWLRLRRLAPFFAHMDSTFRSLVPPHVFDNLHMSGLRCQSRWMLPGSQIFSSLGVNTNFHQCCHIDVDDNPEGMAMIRYHVLRQNASQMRPRAPDAGCLCFPEINISLQPDGGDIVVFQSHRLVHGVTALDFACQRTAIVLFQTCDVANGCLKCSVHAVGDDI